MCKPTRIYASGYTDVRISLHIYMSLCQIPSYPVPEFDLFASSSRQTLFLCCIFVIRPISKSASWMYSSLSKQSSPEAYWKKAGKISSKNIEEAVESESSKDAVKKTTPCSLIQEVTAFLTSRCRFRLNVLTEVASVNAGSFHPDWDKSILASLHFSAM